MFQMFIFSITLSPFLMIGKGSGTGWLTARPCSWLGQVGGNWKVFMEQTLDRRSCQDSPWNNETSRRNISVSEESQCCARLSGMVRDTVTKRNPPSVVRSGTWVGTKCWSTVQDRGVRSWCGTLLTLFPCFLTLCSTFWGWGSIYIFLIL